MSGRAKNDKDKNRFKILWGAFATASEGEELAKGVRNKEGVSVITPAMHTQDRFALIFQDVRSKKQPTSQTNTVANAEDNDHKQQASKPPPVDVDSATHTINRRLSQITCHFISTFVYLFHSHFVFFGDDRSHNFLRMVFKFSYFI